MLHVIVSKQGHLVPTQTAVYGLTVGLVYTLMQIVWSRLGRQGKSAQQRSQYCTILCCLLMYDVRKQGCGSCEQVEAPAANTCSGVQANQKAVEQRRVGDHRGLDAGVRPRSGRPRQRLEVPRLLR